MSDSTSLLEQVEASQAQKEVTANNLFDAASPAMAYGRHAETCAALTWGYYGTRYGGTPVANGTNVCGASTTTYMVANLTTGAVSFATSTTNWNDDATYGRCYLIVTGADSVTSYEDHRYGPGGISAGGGEGAAGTGLYNLYDPHDAAYGCIGDGTTDDTAGFQDMVDAINLAAVPAAVVVWPGLNYYLPAGGFVFEVPVTIIGYGCGDELGTLANAASALTCNSATAEFFHFEAAGSMVEKLLIRNAVATPTAGAGLYFEQGGGSRVVDCYIHNFWNCVDHENSREFYMRGTCLNKPANWSIRIRNVGLPDGGDCCISDCQFIAETHSAAAAIRIESGGGVKITNVKGNVRSGGFVRGIDLAAGAGVATSLLQVSNSSFENMTGSPYYIRLTGGASWPQMTFTGCQGMTSADVPCWDIDGGSAANLESVTFTGCIPRTTQGSPTARPFKLRNINKVALAGNQEFGGYGQAKLDVSGITYLHNLDRNGNNLLTDGANIALPLENFDSHRVTLAGNRTIDNPTHPTGGQTFLVRIKQDATGSRTLAYGSKYKFPGAVVPVLSTAADAEDMLVCHWDGNNDTYFCNLTKAYA